MTISKLSIVIICSTLSIKYIMISYKIVYKRTLYFGIPGVRGTLEIFSSQRRNVHKHSHDGKPWAKAWMGPISVPEFKIYLWILNQSDFGLKSKLLISGQIHIWIGRSRRFSHRFSSIPILGFGLFGGVYWTYVLQWQCDRLWFLNMHHPHYTSAAYQPIWPGMDNFWCPSHQSFACEQIHNAKILWVTS